MNGLELLRKLEANNTVSTDDENLFKSVLAKLGFNNAVIVSGIVYLEGMGTLRAPPAPINQIAGMILKSFNL